LLLVLLLQAPLLLLLLLLVLLLQAPLLLLILLLVLHKLFQFRWDDLLQHPPYHGLPDEVVQLTHILDTKANTHTFAGIMMMQ
jgi:hypothetical protein